jgi:hypothetical protein
MFRSDRVNQTFVALIPSGFIPGEVDVFESIGRYGTCEEALWFIEKGIHLGTMTATGRANLQDLREMVTGGTLPGGAVVCLHNLGAVCWIRENPNIMYRCHRRALGFIRRTVREITRLNPSFEGV